MTQIIHVSMRFLDVHPMEGLDESLLKELQNLQMNSVVEIILKKFGFSHLLVKAIQKI
ncbi:MAG: hypothetical protein WAM42_08300 [Candidatus Nitrosopolaris sp.]